MVILVLFCSVFSIPSSRDGVSLCARPKSSDQKAKSKYGTNTRHPIQSQAFFDRCCSLVHPAPPFSRQGFQPVKSSRPVGPHCPGINRLRWHAATAITEMFTASATPTEARHGMGVHKPFYVPQVRLEKSRWSSNPVISRPRHWKFQSFLNEP